MIAAHQVVEIPATGTAWLRQSHGMHVIVHPSRVFAGAPYVVDGGRVRTVLPMYAAHIYR